MRSRFEDCIEAHRLLLAPMDGIESQFKSSYGMAVGVLRTRDMESAKNLVEKSFGNFLRRKQLGPLQVSPPVKSRLSCSAISRNRACPAVSKVFMFCAPAFGGTEQDGGPLGEGWKGRCVYVCLCVCLWFSVFVYVCSPVSVSHLVRATRLHGAGTTHCSVRNAKPLSPGMQ